MSGEETMSIQRAERVDHQLIRGIGIPALTANIVSSTIGAGIFVIPATVARGLGSAAPLAFVCCAIAMVLFVTCFAIAGSRVSLTGGLYAYVEVAFGRYVGFMAGMLYFLTALGAVAGVVNVLANSVALVVPFLGSPFMRIVVMLAVYGSLVFINIRGVREGAVKARFAFLQLGHMEGRLSRLALGAQHALLLCALRGFGLAEIGMNRRQEHCDDRHRSQ